MRKGMVKKLVAGAGVSALMAFPAVTLMSGTASADTCYTGCSQPTSGLPVTSGDGTTPSAPTSSPSGLAFTGADLSELVIISAGALGAGTVLVRVSRRRHQTA
jgi:hypothetical protein